MLVIDNRGLAVNMSGSRTLATNRLVVVVVVVVADDDKNTAVFQLLSVSVRFLSPQCTI